MNELSVNTAAMPVREQKLFMNPMIKKLNKVHDVSEENPATYGGIAAKTVFFMIMVAVGFLAYFVFHNVIDTGETVVVMENQVYIHEIIIVLVALLCTCLAPILAFLIKPLVPVFGSIFCISVGYSITWAGFTYGGEYANLIWLAVAITAVLVSVMAILYATGAVKVNHKFKAVVSTLFFVTIGCAFLGFVFSFIPALRDVVAYFRENYILSIVSGVLYVIIACLFLLVDFDTISHTVNDRLPKKYEWIAAFGLAYTVIWLFLKVLDLLLKAKSNESK